MDHAPLLHTTTLSPPSECILSFYFFKQFKELVFRQNICLYVRYQIGFNRMGFYSSNYNAVYLLPVILCLDCISSFCMSSKIYSKYFIFSIINWQLRNIFWFVNCLFFLIYCVDVWLFLYEIEYFCIFFRWSMLFFKSGFLFHFWDLIIDCFSRNEFKNWRFRRWWTASFGQLLC